MTDTSLLRWPTYSAELRALVNDNFAKLAWVPRHAPDASASPAERMTQCAAVQSPGPFTPEEVARRYPWVSFNMASAALELAERWPDDAQAHDTFFRTCLEEQPFLGVMPRLARYWLHASKGASTHELTWLARITACIERRLAPLPILLPFMPLDATVALYWRLRGVIAHDVVQLDILSPQLIAAVECFLLCGVIARAGAADVFSAWDAAGSAAGALSVLADRDRNYELFVEKLLGKLLVQPLPRHLRAHERACLPVLLRLRMSHDALTTGCAFDVMAGG